MAEQAEFKQLRLRYAGKCRECGAELVKGSSALYDVGTKQVICLACARRLTHSEAVATPPVAYATDTGPVPETVSDVDEAANEDLPLEASATEAIESGTAGASARREFDRRVAKREQRIRERHPKLGGLILTLSDEPQSTSAWQRGAKGEQLLGKRLDELASRGVRLLHDRRIRGTRSNIDHIAISAAGVFVLDAKRYQGRPHLKVEGGLLRPRTETLMVGTRSCDVLVDGMTRQVRLVTEARAVSGPDVPVTGMLVFVEADWPLLGGDFATHGVKVLWPKKATELILKPGPLADERISDLHRILARAFPPA